MRYQCRSPSRLSSRWPDLVTILTGLMLAVVGAAAVAMLVLGLSHLYVAVWHRAVAELSACVFCGIAFFSTYGAFLDRLDQRWPREAAPEDAETGAAEAPAGEHLQYAPVDRRERGPVPTCTVISLATVGYGLVIMIGGAVWTRGSDRAFNLAAGLVFLVLAGVVIILGRKSPRNRHAGESV